MSGVDIDRAHRAQASVRGLAEIAEDLRDGLARLAACAAELLTAIAAEAPGAAPVAPVATPKPAPLLKTRGIAKSNESRAKRYDYRGQQLTIHELAALAGCTRGAMEQRLKVRTPDVAVEMGGSDRTRQRRPVVRPEKAPVPSLPPARSVFEHRAAPTPVAIQTSTRVSPRLTTPVNPPVMPPKDTAAAAFPRDAVVTVPPDVKRTVWQPTQTEAPLERPFSSLRPGQYLDEARPWAKGRS